jgi:hypothetical protein
MRLDLHIHSNYSKCSAYNIRDMEADILNARMKAATVTDHGSARACHELKKRLKDVSVLFGIELSALEGDFLLFSTDIEYISSLTQYVKSVADIRNDDTCAVVWAHPKSRTAKGWRAPAISKKATRTALARVDGIELFNGRMLALLENRAISPAYFIRLGELAEKAGLAVTGGSDAHTRGYMMCSWTEFPPGARKPADFISAIKNRKTRASFRRDFFPGSARVAEALA